MTNDSLGRYRIIRELGRGSMGRVFLAHDPEIDRNVAVKTIHIFASLPEPEREDARQRFLREVRAAGKLLHPGIVTIFDVGQEGGTPYLAMELVRGRTLDAYCRKGKLLPAERVVEIVANAAEALHYAHQAGIVHRDIKPSNLVHVSGETVKIMDFGLAKDPHTSLTQDGALLGTPSYMAPEQVRGEAVSGRSDLFALAVVLYEMLTGEKPFTGESVSSVLYRIVNEEPRDASVVDTRVPRELSAFLKKALAKKPADRFTDGEAFAAELRKAARTLKRTATQSSQAKLDPATRLVAPPPPRATARRSSRAPFVLGAAVVFVLLAVGAYVVRKGLIPLGESAAPAGGATDWFEATVRTEPPGLAVLLDGEPVMADVVRFSVSPPHGVVSASHRCRTAEHELAPLDAGGELVLVTEPVEVEAEVIPGAPGAAVRLNGVEIGAAPAVLHLDLCRDNEIEVSAEGYYTKTVALEEGISPLEARSLVGAISLEPIPMGRLRLPETRLRVAFFVDGERVRRDPAGIELTAGEHRVRAVSNRHWVDVEATVEIPAGGIAEPDLRLPALAELAVQAFPPNCKVYLRRPGGAWTFLDTTPYRGRIAEGTYDVRVEFVPTGDRKERRVTLQAGRRDPVRFSFAGSRR